MGKYVKSLRVFMASAFAIVLMWPALAQNLNPDILREIYDDCMVGCVSANNGQICENLCRCAAAEVGSRMSESRYTAFKSDMDSDSVKAEDAVLMNEIGRFCADQAGL